MISWLVVLTVLGFLLIAIDFFVPGTFLSMIGCVCLLIAVGICFNEFGVTGGVVALAALLVLFAILTPLWVRYSPKTPLGRKLTLGHSERDYQSAPNEFKKYVGRLGTTQTILRPSGIAQIGEDRVDVICDTGHIEAGKQIRVTRVEGARIAVEEVRAS